MTRKGLIQKAKRRAAAWVGVPLVVLLGCGGGSGDTWTGTFGGAIATTGSCVDVPPIWFPAHFVISANGSTLTWTAPCGAMATATVDGSTATVHPYDCPALTAGPLTESLTITGGTLTLAGNSLSVTFNGTATTSGMTGPCLVTFTGTLARQE